MMYKCIALILLVVQTCSVYGTVSSPCSYYQFESQPPLTLDCDPYDRIVGRMIWRFRTSCKVKRVSSDAGTFDIHWFRRDPVTLNVTNLGRLDLFDSQAPPSSSELHVVYGLHVFAQDFREDMLGDVWCQVINTTTTPHTGLGISNILTILHPDQYNSSLEICGGVIRNETVTCADINIQQDGPQGPIGPLPIATTMASSSTKTTESNSVPKTQTLLSKSHELKTTIATISSSPTKQPSLSLAHSTNSQSTSISVPSILLIHSSSTSRSSNIPVSTKDSETTASSGSNIVLHVAYSLTVAVIAFLGLVILAVCMSRKKIRKAFEKQPETSPTVIITHATDTAPTGFHSQETSLRIQNQIIVTTDNDGDVQYEPLQMNTMDPTPEYSMMDIDTHYERLRTDTMNPDTLYSVVVNIRNN